jgi:Flp pilus assembly protein TadG
MGPTQPPRADHPTQPQPALPPPPPARPNRAPWVIGGAIAVTAAVAVAGLLALHANEDGLASVIQAQAAQIQTLNARQAALKTSQSQLAQTQKGAVTAHLGVCWQESGGSAVDLYGSTFYYTSGVSLEPAQVVSGVYQCGSGYQFVSVVPTSGTNGGGGQ